MDSPERSHAGVQETLLQAITRHDQKAVIDLYGLQSQPLYTLILRITADESAAEDILQETFLRVWDDAASYNPDLLSPSAWLTRIARDLAVGHVRSKSLSNLEQQSLSKTSGRQQGESTDNEFDLTPQQRVLIESAYFKGCTQSELAQVFNLPLLTVRAELCSGILALKVMTLGGEQHTPMMSRYLEELAMINSVGALDGEDLGEFKRLSPNVTMEAQKEIASYEQAATLIALASVELTMPPAAIKGKLMKRIHESLSTQPPSQ